MLLKKFKKLFGQSSEGPVQATETGAELQNGSETLSRAEKELSAYLQENGSYHFKLKVVQGVVDRKTEKLVPDALGVECELDGFSMMVRSRSGLMRVQHIAASAKMSMSLNYDLEDVAVYFGQEGSEQLIDGEDELLGLSTEGDYTLVVVPKDSGAALNVRPKSVVPKGTCPITKPAFKP